MNDVGFLKTKLSEDKQSRFKSSQECVVINKITKCETNKTKGSKLSFKDFLLNKEGNVKDTRRTVYENVPNLLT